MVAVGVGDAGYSLYRIGDGGRPCCRWWLQSVSVTVGVHRGDTVAVQLRKHSVCYFQNPHSTI